MTEAYQRSIRALSLVMLVVGVVLLAITVANGGGPLSTGVLMGLAFVGVGAGRLWLSQRMSR